MTTETEIAERLAIIPRKRTVTLANCPIGLFLSAGELCLKTEYRNNEGRIDAYIVSSGEFYWGEAPQTIASQRANMVRPVNLVTPSATEATLLARVATLSGLLRDFVNHTEDMGSFDVNCPKCKGLRVRIDAALGEGKP